MKVIETFHRGIKFRSRQEARWAVFFDSIGVKWEYEKEGYDLGDGVLYLPDFWMADLKCWIEIKGEPPTEEENRKAEKLAKQSGGRVYIFFGQIRIPVWGEMDSDSAHLFFPDGGWDNCQWWCQCPVCGKFGIEYEGRAARICRHDEEDKKNNFDSPDLRRAYERALGFRFEQEKR